MIREIDPLDIEVLVNEESERWAAVIDAESETEAEEIRKYILDMQKRIKNIKAVTMLTISLEPNSDLKKGMEVILKLLEDDFD